MWSVTVAGGAALLGVVAAVGLAVAFGPDERRHDPVAEPFARRVAQLEAAYAGRGSADQPASADGLEYLAASGPVVATAWTLRWSVVVGGCFRGTIRPLLDERAHVVVLAGRAEGNPGAARPEACHTNRVAHEVSARLGRPLGARAVVDAVTGRRLPLRSVARPAPG